MAMMKLILVFAVVMGAVTVRSETQDKERKFIAAAGLMYAIKQNLRNPDSVVWETALVSKDGKTLCVQYRAQNGFGGMAREIVVMTEKKASTKPAFWNKYCLKNMDDYLYARQAVK